MDQQALIIIGLGPGDEGKGTVSDLLTRRTGAHTVVRFNGGGQAGHNVVTPEGLHHTFSQFGAGTFVPGVRTYLPATVVVSVPNLLAEADHLALLGVTDACARLSIDRRAPVVSPFHRLLNRLREHVRGADRHGSVGVGFGETVADVLIDAPWLIRAGDLGNGMALRHKLRDIRDVTMPQFGVLAEALTGAEREQLRITLTEAPLIEDWADAAAIVAKRVPIVDGEAAEHAILTRPGTVIFEGAQGVLLDEWYGFHPHTTWSTTTPANADALLARHHYAGRRTAIGVVRTYATRHGSGPFVSEDATLAPGLPEAHNATHQWQGAFRVGAFDFVATRYALAAAGTIDALAVTHLDRCQGDWPACVGYLLHQPPPGFVSSPDGCGYGLALPDGHDLARQAAVTHALRRCTPALTALSEATPARVLTRITETLGLPVAIRSWGPTAREKWCDPAVCDA